MQNKTSLISGDTLVSRNSLPTVDELNAIHAEWMAVDSTGPKSEINRVCKLMGLSPRRYISGRRETGGIVILDGAPMSAKPVDWDYCLKLCAANGGRIDVAWNGAIGQWYKV